MRYRIFQVDAFASAPFEGNPAAVVLLEDWLGDTTLQAIAEENNLSETAFLVPVTEARGTPSTDHYHLRWFTPQVEVELCGHATLASAFVVFEFLAASATSVRFETVSGPLTVQRSEEGLVMDFPSLPPGGRFEPSEDQIEALGATPEACFSVREVHGAPYQLWVFARTEQVAALEPAFFALAANIIATAPADPRGDHDFVSRFFGPLSGVPEDPVTGSAHCTLAPYWATRLGKMDLRARQISVRGGDIGCRLRGDRVELTGECCLVLDGELILR